MGCGYGRNKVSRSTRLAKLRKNQKRSLKKLSTSKKKPITEPSKKLLVCKSCPYGSQTSREKKAGIYVCHKTNRLINNIIKDPKFKCPIKKWN